MNMSCTGILGNVLIPVTDETFNRLFMCWALTGAPFCCQSDLRPAFLLHGHHHCSQPHLWGHHWYFCWPEEREAEERGDSENDVFHLWWGNNQSHRIDAELGNSEMMSVLDQSCSCGNIIPHEEEQQCFFNIQASQPLTPLSLLQISFLELRGEAAQRCRRSRVTVGRLKCRCAQLVAQIKEMGCIEPRTSVQLRCCRISWCERGAVFSV